MEAEEEGSVSLNVIYLKTSANDFFFSSPKDAKTRDLHFVEILFLVFTKSRIFYVYFFRVGDTAYVQPLNSIAASSHA